MREKMMKKILSGGMVVLVALAMSGVFSVGKAQAASLTLKSDTMSRLQGGQASDHTIKFKTPTGVQASTDTITIAFPDFTTTGVVFGDMDLKVDAACDGVYEIDKTLAGTNGSAIWGASFATTTLTLTPPSNATTGEIAATACVEVLIGTNAAGPGTHQLVNPAAATKTIAFAGGFGDTGNLLVSLITDDTVNITASVAETINFSISDVEIGFGALNSSNARWATADAAVGSDTDVSAHNIVVGTNAAGGYSLTYIGSTLTSGGNTIDPLTAGITDDANGTPTTEQFGISIAKSDSATITAGYDHATLADWKFAVSATPAEIAKETVASADETFSLYYLANIATLTQAGSYSADITYIATATF